MEEQAHGTRTDQEFLKTIFHLFDKDNDGRITADELTTVLKSLNIVNNKELKMQVDKVMEDGDKDKNGTIDFEEFLVFMEPRMSHHQSKQKEMTDAFRMFDCDKNGFIDANELKCVMNKLGHNLTDTEVGAMIKDADLDGNGLIDFEEFVYMMSKE